LKYKNNIAINITNELISVYKNNKYEAFTLRPREPKIPTIKYIGINTASNKI